MSPLLVDRFERFLRFCHLEIDKEAVFDGYRCENARYQKSVHPILNIFEGDIIFLLFYTYLRLGYVCPAGLSKGAKIGPRKVGAL